MSLLTRAAATLAATAVVLAPCTVGVAHADAPSLPHLDPFYKYDAQGNPTAPPKASKPGDVLSTRSVTTTLTDLVALLTRSGKTFSATATQLLYRTQDEQKHPSQTVTTVIKPSGVSRGVVAYLSFYDGLGDKCDPSYTLRGDTVNQEAGIIGQLVESGYTVTIPDFEGETLDWAAGHESGWSTLDAIRATERSLGLPASTTPVGLMGYSGGSIAGEWAAELAPSYAEDLHLVGTAIGGVPVNLRHVVEYVDGDTDAYRNGWFGVIPAATVSLGRANGKDFAPYLSVVGKEIADHVSDLCIEDFADEYPDKHLADLVNNGVKFLDEPDVAAILDSSIMGEGRIPQEPMLIVQGRSKDHLGDGVMVADDVKALATTYKAAGVPVTYTEVSGVNQSTNDDLGAHSAVGQSFVLQALSFLGKRLPVPTTSEKTPIHATLKGHSQGLKDILVVRAKGASGASVQMVRLRHGHHQVVGHGTIKHGKVTIKVKDRNGTAKTRYRATVAATSTTQAATTRVLKLR
jgi:pimeloyl-ACP methyl ester carboxylesterase